MSWGLNVQLWRSPVTTFVCIPRICLAFTLAALGCARAPISAPSASPPAGVESLACEEDATFQALLEELRTELKANGIPGGAVAVVQKGKLSCAAGLGVKRFDLPEAKVTAQTRFRWASTTKSLTAAMVMSLVEEKVLAL